MSSYGNSLGATGGGRRLQSSDEGFRPARLIGLAGASLFVLTAIFGSYYTIGAGERGVVTHYGNVVGLAGPGLHFKLPLVTGITKVDIQTQAVNWSHDASGDSRMSAYSKDQQPAQIALTVNWHITDPEAIYIRFGSEDGLRDRVLISKASEAVKNVFGQFDAADAIQQRAKLNAETTAALQSIVKGLPVIVDSVQVVDISFSTQYEQAVEARMQAIVQQQQAEAEKAKRIIQADAELYQRQRQADAVKYTGLAEAAAIQAKNEALKNSPDIVAYTAATKWDGKLPETMVPGGALPFLNVK